MKSRKKSSRPCATCALPECDLLTIGQYLRPSAQHLPVVRYYRPEEFAEFKRQGEALGFVHVEAGPLVRSSYHAATQEAAAAQQGQRGLSIMNEVAL